VCVRVVFLLSLTAGEEVGEGVGASGTGRATSTQEEIKERETTKTRKHVLFSLTGGGEVGGGVGASGTGRATSTHE